MGRALSLIAAAALAGCGVPSAAVTPATYSPLRESLAFLPASAPVVAVVQTDPQDPGLRRAAGGGALAALQRAVAGAGLSYGEIRPLLGNPAVIGKAHLQAEPVAVLATHDAAALQRLARARVDDGAADPVGRYRGASLYSEIGWAFAVRDRVLIVSRRPQDLMDALDQRDRDDGFDAAQLNAVIPAADPPAAFARGYVDLAALVAAGGAPARAVPLLDGAGAAGIALGASAEGLRAVASAALEEVSYDDLPALEPVTGMRPALPAGAPAVAVADLAPLLVAAERAVRAALPISSLRIDALRSRLQGAKVDFAPALLSGAATLEPGPVLRLQPSRPAVLEAAVERAAKNLDLPAAQGLYRWRGVRFGFSTGAFVAGRAPARALHRVAARPTVPLSSPLLIRIPDLPHGLPAHAEITVGGGPERLTAYLAAPFGGSGPHIPRSAPRGRNHR